MANKTINEESKLTIFVVSHIKGMKTKDFVSAQIVAISRLGDSKKRNQPCGNEHHAPLKKIRYTFMLINVLTK